MSVNDLLPPFTPSGPLLCADGRTGAEYGIPNTRFIMWAQGVDTYTHRPGMIEGVLADIPTGLGTPDMGLLYWVTDFRHLIRWTGTAWEWAPAEDGSGKICVFLSNPGTGWAACDGSTVTKMNADATTTVVTTPDLTGDVFIKGVALASYTGTQEAATAGTLTGDTDDESAHTHLVAGTTGTQSGVSQLVGLGIAGAAAAPHTHAVSIASGAGSAHHHALAGVTTTAPSEIDGGLPLRIGLSWYIRL